MLTGKVASLTCVMGGANHLSARQLTADSANVTLNGSGDASVYASQRIVAANLRRGFDYGLRQSQVAQHSGQRRRQDHLCRISRPRSAHSAAAATRSSAGPCYSTRPVVCPPLHAQSAPLWSELERSVSRCDKRAACRRRSCTGRCSCRTGPAVRLIVGIGRTELSSGAPNIAAVKLTAAHSSGAAAHSRRLRPPCRQPPPPIPPPCHPSADEFTAPISTIAGAPTTSANGEGRHPDPAMATAQRQSAPRQEGCKRDPACA